MSKKKILTVDDSQFTRAAITQMFAGEDSYEIIEASDGLSAIEILKKHDFDIDLIFLDFHMPEMSGIEMLQEVKKQRPDFATPTIMLTTELEHKGDGARKLGVVSWIVKPFDAEKLKAITPSVLKHYAIRR